MSTSTTHRASPSDPIPLTLQYRTALVSHGRDRIRGERSRRRAVRGTLAGGAALAVAGAVGLGLVPGRGPVVDAAVADTLERASVATGDTGLEDVAAGQYWYEQWREQQLSCCEPPEGSERPPTPPTEAVTGETWTGVDGVSVTLSRGRLTPSPGGEAYASATVEVPQGVDASADYTEGFAGELGEHDLVEPAVDLSDPDAAPAARGHLFLVPGAGGAYAEGDYAELAALPTEPDELRAYLVDSLDRNPLGIGEPPLELQLFTTASDMLRQPLPSELRAALLQVLAATGGSTQSEVTDLTGRTVVAVGMRDEANGMRAEILFDPSSGLYAGERTVLTAAPEWYDGQVGDVVYESVVVRSGIVDELGERPQG